MDNIQTYHTGLYEILEIFLEAIKINPKLPVGDRNLGELKKTCGAQN